MSVVLKSPATFSFLDKLLPPTPQSSDTCKSLFFFNPSNTSGFLLRPQKLQIFQYDDMCLSVILCCGRPCLSLLSAPPNPSKSCCPSSLKKKKKTPTEFCLDLDPPRFASYNLHKSKSQDSLVSPSKNTFDGGKDEQTESRLTFVAKPDSELLYPSVLSLL